MEINWIKPLKLLSILSIILILSTTSIFAESYPTPSSTFYVNDYANVLDTSTRQYIASHAEALERLTNAQVVVVTVNDLGNKPIEDYSIGLFRAWGIGSSELNNGVLILVDTTGHQTRIEVGYGLEGALPDGKTGRIQDLYIIPHFINNDYSTGIQQGFVAIVNEIYIEYGYEKPLLDGNLSPSPSPSERESIPPILIIIGAILLIPLIILDFRYTGGMLTWTILRMVSRGNSRGGGGSRRGGGGSAGGGGSSRRW